MPTSRLSREVTRDDVPDSPPVQQENPRTKRFSMLKFRNYSESHLAARAKEDARREALGIKNGQDEDAPPVPPIVAQEQTADTPAILKTAPTFDAEQMPERKQRRVPFTRSLSKAMSHDTSASRPSQESARPREKKGPSLRWRRLQGRSTGLDDLYRLSAANAHKSPEAPPAYGQDEESELALPVPRCSESSRSDGSRGSSGDIYGSTTTTTHTVSTHTTFFKLPRRNKNRNSLFPLPVQLPPPDQSRSPDGPLTPRASTSGVSLSSGQRSPEQLRSPPATALQRRHTEVSPTRQQAHYNSLASPHAALAQSALSFAEPGMSLGRNDSQRSRDSSLSSPLQPPIRLGLRDRASTTSSWGRASVDTPPPLTGSTRNSTSTTGRSSLGGFLNLSRFRQNSDAHSPKHGSPGTRSKSNSFALSREALVVPEREEGDTPGKYLERLESAVSRSVIATILSKSSDPFAQAVLRSYLRRFPFFGEPIDMSLRKFLLEAELPKETQQVDRVIQAFADRYHECNPGIFIASDQAYIIAFSLMMLHTDAFNRNNKRKMQKHDYIKNTSGQRVNDEILACFYDNICYTPFVHYEEDVDINGERVLSFRAKKSKLKGAITESGKKPSGPVDPYNLLIDQKLDLLRPAIKDSMLMDDPYNYLGAPLDMQYLQRAFTHTGTLQIISARSRPAAYEGQVNSSHPTPAESQQGIVDLKITKVGTLWRKATKKKKTRSPWQEWGAILTGSQLYLFKNAHWAKGLVHQFMAHQRHGAPRTPVLFQPPLQEFKPDALIKTDDAVALVDSTYNRHKNAFTFVRPGGQEEVLLADNENELNDWLGLINYAATFRAAGVRIRGMVGGAEEDTRSSDVRRLDSTHSTHSIQTPSGQVTVKHRGFDTALAKQVMAARRQIMMQKIREYERELSEMQKQLDDMLRNARHLLVLAPILPKTRDEVIHAAARTDAMLKWIRRDIWKTRCHKDILTLDVQQDGVSASELQRLTSKKEVKELEGKAEEEPDTAKKNLPRLESQHSVSARSPPQSPKSPTSAKSPKSERSSAPARPQPSTTEFMDKFVGDVFRSAGDNERTPKTGEGWRLPPLQLDVENQNQSQPRDKQRGSIASTLLTAPSGASQRQPSWSASSTSSNRLHSPLPRSDGSMRNITPTPSSAGEEIERLASKSLTPEPGPQRTINLDGVVTPESSGRAKGVRRSLQRTLRESHPSQRRHRRNKESESTVRSNDADGEQDDLATPGLERAQGKFILHGKQASVVQFGEDWPHERMKLRRENWRQKSGASDEGEDTNPPQRQDWSRARMASPIVQELSHDGTPDDSTTASMSPSTVASFRGDAEVAREWAARGSVASIDSQALSGTGTDEGSQAGGWDPYDLASADPGQSKKGKNRDTIIALKRTGEQPPQTPPETGKVMPITTPEAIAAVQPQLLSDEDVSRDEQATSMWKGKQKENRRTIIGPTGPGASDSSEASGVGEQDDWFDAEESEESPAPGKGERIGDEELKRLAA